MSFDTCCIAFMVAVSTLFKLLGFFFMDESSEDESSMDLLLSCMCPHQLGGAREHTQSTEETTIDRQGKEWFSKVSKRKPCRQAKATIGMRQKRMSSNFVIFLHPKASFQKRSEKKKSKSQKKNLSDSIGSAWGGVHLVVVADHDRFRVV
jgi:hypothetical protein